MDKDPSRPPELRNKYNKGSIDEFDAMWSNLPDKYRYHFKRGDPENQIQYAFQNHWRVFKRIIKGLDNGKVLEVGCGRGSMAAFFADENYDTHLLDTSPSALQLAKINFAKDGLIGKPVVGDALNLPYKKEIFDVILSIGLFEHFAEINKPLQEQIRVLRKGGFYLGYVVPERVLSAQLLGAPINFALELEYKWKSKGDQADRSDYQKEELFRNHFNAKDYISLLTDIGVQETGYSGLFPVPMISHSYKFPFTLMSPQREKILLKFWDLVMNIRFWKGDPWLCAEKWGLAFLVWARK